jgi:aspartate racemase
MNNKLGILGGMGPLASAEFLQCIYRHNMGACDQDSINIFMHSITSVPDRTKVILANSEELFIDELIKNCTRLSSHNIDKIVICCFTSHCFFNHIPVLIRKKIISLVGIVQQMVVSGSKPSLLLASKGSYQKEVFFKGEDNTSSKFIIVPDTNDQEKVHSLIYDILKCGKDPSLAVQGINDLLEKYKVTSFIAGCTEFHLLNPDLFPGITVIDPLRFLAVNLKEYMQKSVTSQEFVINSGE